MNHPVPLPDAVCRLGSALCCPVESLRTLCRPGLHQPHQHHLLRWFQPDFVAPGESQLDVTALCVCQACLGSPRADVAAAMDSLLPRSSSPLSLSLVGA